MPTGPPVSTVSPDPLPGGAGGIPGPAAPAPAHRHSQRGRRRRWPWGVLALVVLLVVAGVVTAQRIDRPLPSTVVVSTLTRVPVPGPAPTLPWPVVGQGAVSVPALGYNAQSGPESPVPIASLTKMTNAVVILRDHPLAPGASGPTIVITPGDANQFDVDLDNDESNIPLQTGEKLTEYQMLEALINQSANDVAYSLAVWDAGSEAAFVVKMNALAASLGATRTHYVDASGYDPRSVSTASDCLRIAAAGMRIPAFAEIAGKATVTLPLAGTVHNIVSEIGFNGVVGVKSGYTSQAGGCMVLAGYRTLDGRSVLVLAAALGQHVPAPVVVTKGHPAPAASAATSRTTPSPGQIGVELQYPLRYTGPVVEALLDASEAAVVKVPVATPGRTVGRTTVTWGGSTHRAGVVTAGGAWMLGWPTQVVEAAMRPVGVPAGARAGVRAGTAFYALGQQVETVPLVTTAALPEPSWWWRLVHD